MGLVYLPIYIWLTFMVNVGQYHTWILWETKIAVKQLLLLLPTKTHGVGWLLFDQNMYTRQIWVFIFPKCSK